MKQLSVLILSIFLLSNLAVAQNLVNAFTKGGKVFVQFDNGNSKQIVSVGDNDDFHIGIHCNNALNICFSYNSIYTPS